MTSQDWASWLSAIGTIGAFAVSLWLLFVQMLDRRREQEDKKAEQARYVAAWCDLHPPGGNPILWVQNLGVEPIYHLVVRIGPFEVNFKLPPDSENNYIEYVWGNLAPQAKEKQYISRVQIEGERFPNIPSIEIEFTDAQGQFWLRDDMGKLEKISYRRPYD